MSGACHCDFCQKHTGSAFRLSSFFGEDQIIEITGDSSTFNGLEIDGVGIAGSDEFGSTFYFCGTCGSTVYWLSDVVPRLPMASQGGSFVYLDFPPPTFEIWTELRHRWLAPIPDAVAYERFPPS